MADVETRKQVARDFLGALGRGDVDGIARTLAPEVQAVAMGSGFMSGTRDRDTILSAAGTLGSITQNGIAFEIVSMTVEEDRVSCEAAGKSTLVNGTPYNNDYHFLFTIPEDRIVRLKEYYCTKLTEDAFGPLLAQQQQQQ